MFPPDCVRTVAIYHIPTADGVQSYPGSADITTSVAMLPLDRKEHALEGGDYVDPWELYFDPATDVRVGDELLIDGATYYVKKVFDAQFGGLAHKRASISKQA